MSFARVAQDWPTIVACTWRRIGKDNLSALAAAAAFYALLSIFPALTAVVSVYGLIADRSMVKRQITVIQGVLPPEAVTLIATWLQAFVSGPPSRFGVSLIISVLLAFWSAWSATGMLMTAVNTCYGETENRTFVRFNLRAIALAVGLALFSVAALAFLASLPAALGLLPLPEAWDSTIALVRWPALAVIVIVALAIIYHYAPDRAQPKWRWVRVHDLRVEGRELRQDVWLGRRGHHPAALVLLECLRDADRRRAQRGDRTPSDAGGIAAEPRLGGSAFEGDVL